jgi:hypothetical protein
LVKKRGKMKREIECWIEPEDVASFGRGHHDNTLRTYRNNHQVSSAGIKAKLIIEEDRKVTISESEFDEAWKNTKVFPDDTLIDPVMRLKEKIFGKQ